MRFHLHPSNPTRHHHLSKLDYSHRPYFKLYSKNSLVDLVDPSLELKLNFSFGLVNLTFKLNQLDSWTINLLNQDRSSLDYKTVKIHY